MLDDKLVFLERNIRIKNTDLANNMLIGKKIRMIRYTLAVLKNVIYQACHNGFKQINHVFFFCCCCCSCEGQVE